MFFHRIPLKRLIGVCLAVGGAAFAQDLTPAHRNSPKFRAFEEFNARIVVRDFQPGAHDTLAEYSAKCNAATGVSLPEKFSCKDGVDVPGQGSTPQGNPPSARCDRPNVLNGACDPGSHFQVLASTPDAAAVAHCRKVGLPIAGEMYNDIAIIQYNKKNGALCFYQALTNLPGTDIPTPARGEAANWSDGHPHWISPQGTEAIGCAGCHDNGGFIRSEYLAQLTTPPHALPSTSQGFNNRNTPSRFVGKDFANRRSWSIKTANAPGDSGPSCTACHRLAVPNRKAFNQINGTAAHFANVATAADQCVDGKCSKNPHGPSSPIWMRPGQVHYDQQAEATASRFRDCAIAFYQSNFTAAPSGCEVTPLAEPWTEDANPPSAGSPPSLSYYLQDDSERIAPISNHVLQ